MTHSTRPDHSAHQTHTAAAGLCLNRLEVSNFAGISHAVLEPQTRGVTVIHGPNEAGKSSLLQAFELLLSDTKPKTTAKSVAKFFPVGEDVKPVITADLTIGQYELRYQKSFQDKRVTLNITSPRVENLVSDDAMRRFAEIMEQHVDTDLRSALFVEQGRDVSKIDLTGIATLTEALHSADGDGPERGDLAPVSTQVSEGVAAELVKLVDREDFSYRDRTKSRRPKGDLKRALDNAEHAADVLSEAERVYADAQKAISDLDRFYTRRSGIRAEKPEAHRAVEQCQEALKEAQQRATALDTATQKLRSVQMELDLQEEKLLRRQETAAKLETVTQQAQTARETMDAAVAEAATEADKRDAATAEWQAAQAEAQLAQAVYEVVGMTEDVRQLAAQHEELGAQRESVTTIYKEIAEKKRQVDNDPATEQNVAAARDAVAKLHEEKRVREAVSTTVLVDGPAGSTFTHDGREVDLGDEGTQLQLTQHTTLGLGDYQVTISPARDQSAQDSAVDQAAAACVRAFRVFRPAGVDFDADSSDSDLREALTTIADLAEKRSAMEDEIRALESRATSMTGGRTQDQLKQAEPQALSALTEAQRTAAAQAEAVVDRADKAEAAGAEVDTAVASFIADVRQVSGEDDALVAVLTAKDSRLPEVATVKQWRTASSEAAQAAGDRREKVLASPATTTAAQATARCESLEERRDELARELAAEREQVSDDDLAAAVAKAEQDVAQATATWEDEVRRNEGQDDLETVELSLQGAESKVAGLLNEEHQLDINIAKTTENLGNATNAADTLAEARSENERAQRTLARITRQADAAALLCEVLLQARQEAKERYSAPYRKELESLARLVFGTAIDVDVDDNFQVSNRSADGKNLVKDQLSGGVKEQLEILQLLATARLVGEGESVPIFLDDVLGFSDEQRAEKMNLVLGKLGQRNQIVIFTCDRQRFDRIPGAQTVAIDTVTGVE